MSAPDSHQPAQITSPTNSRVKWLVSLRKRRVRDDEGVTLVEGYDELRLALEVSVAVQTLFYCPDLVADPSRLNLVDEAARAGADVVPMGRAAFVKASYREGPDGWLALVADPTRKLDDLRLSDVPLVLVCEGVEKPGNLGAIVRTAEAAGVDAAIAASPVADWGNPNVVRASKGTVFAVPIATGTSEAVCEWLRQHGLQIVVATPDAATLITDVDLTGPTAIVVGAEHEGVSAGWLEAADAAAKLPMFGRVNSLNVATSAAVVLYEAVRQRS